jgi:hypothetical protein
MPPRVWTLAIFAIRFWNKDFLSCLEPILSQPHFERVWGWDSHSRNGVLGVLWDSWKFRVWLQGSKHVALGRSLYHWKPIEV